MAFHLLKNLTSTYTWPVKATIPANGGNVMLIKFDAEFNRLDSERTHEMLDQSNDNRPKTDKALLAEVLVGLKAKNEAGGYEAISAADEAELRAVQGIDRAIALAFFASLFGEKAKN